MINFNIDFLLTRRESSPLYVDVMIEIVVSSKSFEVMQYHAATLAEQSIKSQLPFLSAARSRADDKCKIGST